MEKRTLTIAVSLVASALTVVACGGSSAQRGDTRSTTETTSADRHGSDAVDGQSRAPAGAATAWTAEGGPASPGVPSTGRVVEVPDAPAARDAGAW